MHKTQMYENLMDMLEREVKDISNKSDLDPQTLDNLYKIAMSIKAVDKHMETLEGEESRGRSYSSYARRSRDGSYERSYGDSYDGSYNRAYERANDGSYDSYEGMSNARRSRERYSQDRYSRDNAKQKMISKLTTLMDDTMSESERQAISDCIERLR